MLTGDTDGATAVDLRTGRRVWERADAAKAPRRSWRAGRTSASSPSPTEFLWLSPEDGRIEHRVRFADQFAAHRT